jgi:hypothetical protein
MALTLNKIEIVTSYKHLQIREVDEKGNFYRRVVHCNEIFKENEYQAVKDKATELWTDEVKSAWTAKQEESTP